MKKALEDELMSLAHRILQLRGRNEIEELKNLSGELYEKLSVLAFTERHFSGPQPTIGQRDIKEALSEEALEIEPANKDEESIQSSDLEENTESIPKQEESIGKVDSEQSPITEPTSTNQEKEESFVEEVDPEPSAAFEDQADQENEQIQTEKDEETPKKEEIPTPITDKEPQPTPQEVTSDKDNIYLKTEADAGELEENDIPEDDLYNIGIHYDDLPEFEPKGPTQSVDDLEDVWETKPEEEPTSSDSKDNNSVTEEKKGSPAHNLFSSTERPKTKNNPQLHKRSLNDQLNYGVKFGLNDRIAFINNLFDGNISDYNRVISQLNTFEKYGDAKSFIVDQVKPDYNWREKGKYEERFLMALERKMDD